MLIHMNEKGILPALKVYIEFKDPIIDVITYIHTSIYIYI